MFPYLNQGQNVCTVQIVLPTKAMLVVIIGYINTNDLPLFGVCSRTQMFKLHCAQLTLEFNMIANLESALVQYAASVSAHTPRVGISPFFDVLCS